MNKTHLSSFPDEGSLLVVAHPDDEILWFGSVVERVGKIVICFLNDPASPELAGARERVLAEHPLRDRIVCLGLHETCTFNQAGWPIPETTKYGLKITRSRQGASAYKARYRQLERELKPLVEEASSVITHNPWGEYGHEEHVLVHRAATSLAESTGTDCWYDNYASSWSEDLMRRYLDKSEHEIVGCSVDTEKMERIADVYRTQGAWTWFDEYRWFREEFFVRGPLRRVETPGFGWMFPINLIRLQRRD
jgi:LmbE family N-acetylglucosaminyl deacetylase